MKLGRYCADAHCYRPHAGDYFWNAVVCRCNRPEVQCCHSGLRFFCVFCSSPDVRFIYRMLRALEKFIYTQVHVCRDSEGNREWM